MQINEKVVAYANQILAGLPKHSTAGGGSGDETETASLSVLDPHPELRTLERKLDLQMEKLDLIISANAN